MEEKLLFAITTFFPNYPILKSSIQDVWDLKCKSPTTNHLFDRRIIFGKTEKPTRPHCQGRPSRNWTCPSNKPTNREYHANKEQFTFSVRF